MSNEQLDLFAAMGEEAPAPAFTVYTGPGANYLTTKCADKPGQWRVPPKDQWAWEYIPAQEETA